MDTGEQLYNELFDVFPYWRNFFKAIKGFSFASG
jgi:hypothetical protein